METQATEPDTQPYLDPRGSRRSPSLAVEDVADILVQLHPCSAAALEAVELCRENAPQHILNNESLHATEHAPASQLRTPPLAHDDHDDGVLPSQTQELTVPYSSSQVIALRLSSRVLDVKMGFAFGRDKAKSDVLIKPNHPKMKVSGLHFRIYINDQGILMIEDCSTNGTFVDNICLKRSRKGFAPSSQFPSRRVLEHGSKIEVITYTDADTRVSEKASFFAEVPRLATADAIARRQRNIEEYFSFRRQAQDEADQNRNLRRNGNGPLLHVLPTRHAGLADSLIGIGSSRFTTGMHWDGGTKYSVIRQIGQGAYAIVYAIATQDTGDVYAAKEIQKGRLAGRASLDEKIENEILIMKRVSHPHIVDLIDSHDSGDHLYLILEYMPFGDLRQYINPSLKLPEEFAKKITHQLCRAVKHIHALDITHRDIKPDNILLKSRDPMWIKLSDFGLSKVIEEEGGNVLKTFCGTLLYCAPEVFPHYNSWNQLPTAAVAANGHNARYDQKVDIWSVAAVMFELLVQKPAYPAKIGGAWGDAMLEGVMTSDVDWNRVLEAGYSQAALEFLKAMLKVNPADRPTAHKCLQYDWIREVPDLDTALSQLDTNDVSNGFHQEADDMDDDLSPGLSDFEFPDNSTAVPTPHIPAGPSRLFGEVGQSGPADSGIFGGQPIPPIRVPALYDSASSGLPLPDRYQESTLASTVSQIEDLRVDSRPLLDRPNFVFSPSFLKRARDEEQSDEVSQAIAKRTMREADHTTDGPAMVGRLVPIEASISDTVIELTERISLWGRWENCSHRWPDSMDRRIPRVGMEFVLWGPGLKDDSVPRHVWPTLSDTHVFLKTRSSSGLTINGNVHFPKQLSTANDRYGKLRTGDVIEVFADEKKKERLAYRCEFYLGASMPERQPSESFLLETQPEISTQALGRAELDKGHLLDTRAPSSEKES